MKIIMVIYIHQSILILTSFFLASLNFLDYDLGYTYSASSYCGKM